MRTNYTSLRTSFLMLCLLFSASLLRAQVVINEILPNGTVELKNLGNEMVDVSALWLCSFPDYTQIQDLNLTCGATMLEAGGLLAIDNFNHLTAADGELGLYSVANFENANAILDYVEWGSTGHQRSSVAVAAGIWTTGNFVPALAEGQSLAYDGEGDTPEDWMALATPNICSENQGSNTGVQYKAILTGRNEVLPVVSKGCGEVNASLDGNTLTLSGSFSGLSSAVNTNIAGGAHIHLGYAGQNGALTFPLALQLSDDGTSGSFAEADNSFELTDEQVEALNNRQFYINVHTMTNGSGEIRGQLLPEANAYFASNLFGSYEVPSVMTGGHGAVVIELNDDQLTLSGTFGDLEGNFASQIAGGAHIHLGMAGQNGGIQFRLNTTLNDDQRGGVFKAADNTFTLTQDQLSALEGRRFYVNIHTAKSTSGEIRGQIVSARAKTVFRAHLSGSNEKPVVTTTASGMVLAEVMADNQVVVSGSYNQLESDLATAIAGGAHLHTAMAGSNGPVAFPLTSNAIDNRSGTFPAADNQYSFSADQLDLLYARSIYSNIHSVSNTSGEVRGQLLPESPINFTGFLSNIFTNPGVQSNATGGVKAELSGKILTVSGSFSDLSSPLATQIAGGAHIHLGYAGSNGGVIFRLTSDLSDDQMSARFPAASNRFELTDEQIGQIRARRFYVNVHSGDNPSGELRSQLLHEATTYFVAPLSGASEVPPVNTPAGGMGIVEVNGSTGFLTGSFSGLMGNFASNIAGGAHIHSAFAGSNGGIKVFVNVSVAENLKGGIFEVSNNVFAISSGLLDTMRMRMHYLNIHSEAVNSGEIRGQLLPLANNYFTTTLAGFNEPGVVPTTGNGAMKFERVGSQLKLSGSFAGLIGDFNVNIAGGSHIHQASVGTNGGIVYRLNPNLSPDLKSGFYKAADNTFTLSDDQLMTLLGGDFYVNLHTTEVGSGEIRGQILAETNQFPSGPLTFTMPADGTNIVIEGPGTQIVKATWVPADDRDEVVYIGQLGITPDFSGFVIDTLLFDTSFMVDYFTADAALALAGVEVGESVTVFYRVIASDGALQTVGPTASAIITRGVVTDVAEEGADLSLTISASVEEYNIYEDVVYTVTLTNDGPETATNIVVSARLPDGMVFTSSQTATGEYNLFFEEWTVPSLAPSQQATLTLQLFPLVEGVPITNFVEVVAVDQSDPDSAPGNGDGTTPNEDDEAAIIVAPAFIPPMGGITSDLSLSISPNVEKYDIYTDVVYTITLTNNGPDVAANIEVSAGLPTGMVFTNSSATHGEYNLFFEKWNIDLLDSGESAVLTLTLFTLIGDGDIRNFVEVVAVDQDDPDSNPGNGNGVTPQEDDEAVTVISPATNLIEGGAPALNRSIDPTSVKLYPVPASLDLRLSWESRIEGESYWKIMSLSGQVVLEQKIELSKGYNELRIDLSPLSEGQYYLLMDQEAWPFQKISSGR